MSFDPLTALAGGAFPAIAGSGYLSGLAKNLGSSLGVAGAGGGALAAALAMRNKAQAATNGVQNPILQAGQAQITPNAGGLSSLQAPPLGAMSPNPNSTNSNIAAALMQAQQRAQNGLGQQPINPVGQ